MKCRHRGVPLDDRNLVWRAAAALWKALGRAGRPARRGGDDRQGDPDAGGARRRERGRGCGAAGVSRGCGVARRSRCCARSRPIWALMCRSSCPAAPRWGSAAAKRSIRSSTCRRTAVVIVRPPFGVSTAEAYAWYDEDRAAGLQASRASCSSCPCPWPTRAAQMINDLEPPVVRRHPEIADAEDGAAGSGRRRGGDVRQRIGGVRPVPEPRRGAARSLKPACRGAARGRSSPGR